MQMQKNQTQYMQKQNLTQNKTVESMLNISGFKVGANNSTPLIKERKTGNDSYALQAGAKCWKRGGEDTPAQAALNAAGLTHPVTAEVSRCSGRRGPDARRWPASSPQRGPWPVRPSCCLLPAFLTGPRTA